ncbi:hypothetical protein V5799_002225 [Amblyomma americanum]|uniref:Uncharacterized protein n=1 Tax=Amblyomma americanum TaxID=6943 RepID=A0AAQ4CXX9_AMBAM
MKRSLPKTVRYLLTEMNATMMNGVNALGENTLENIIPLLTGQHMEEAESGCWGGSDQFLDNCTFLWTMFADAGYRTLYAEDAPNISTFNYLKLGFLHQPTDYYSRPFVLPFEAELGHKKCISVVKTFDPRWRAQSLYEGGHLNNTIVVFLSDHGMRWGSIRRTFAGLLEGRLPGYLWYLPRSLSLQHPDLVRVFKANAFRLTTPLDVYATLRNVLEDFALLSASGSEAFQVAAAVVREINRILEPYEDRCASLRLLRVDAAYTHTLDDPGVRTSVSVTSVAKVLP